MLMTAVPRVKRAGALAVVGDLPDNFGTAATISRLRFDHGLPARTHMLYPSGLAVAPPCRRPLLLDGPH